MGLTLNKVLSLTSATTPALVTAIYNGDPDNGGGLAWGSVQERPIFPIQAVRANNAAITAVKFELQFCRDISAPKWIPVKTVLLSDTEATPAVEQSLAVANNSTAEDALTLPKEIGLPFMPVFRIVAKAVTADAAAGDSCSAWAWL